MTLHSAELSFTGEMRFWTQCAAPKPCPLEMAFLVTLEKNGKLGSQGLR